MVKYYISHHVLMILALANGSSRTFTGDALKEAGFVSE